MDEGRNSKFKRNKLHKTAKQTNLETEWGRFGKIKKYVISKIRARKIEFLKELVNKASDPNIFGQKDWWRLVKLFLNKKGIDTDVIPPLAHNGNIYYSNKEKANILNEVSNAIQNLDTGKATGPNQVDHRLLIATAAIIADPSLNYLMDLFVKTSSPLFGK